MAEAPRESGGYRVGIATDGVGEQTRSASYFAFSLAAKYWACPDFVER